VVIALVLKSVMGLRPSLENEELGLDESDHGESGYHPDEGGYHGALPEGAAMSASAAPVLAKGTP